MICAICKKEVKPLDAHMGRLEGKLITTHIECWNIKVKEITVDIANYLNMKFKEEL